MATLGKCIVSKVLFLTKILTKHEVIPIMSMKFRGLISPK